MREREEGRERAAEGGRERESVCTLMCFTGVNVCDVGVARWMKEAETKPRTAIIFGDFQKDWVNDKLCFRWPSDVGHPLNKQPLISNPAL